MVSWETDEQTVAVTGKELWGLTSVVSGQAQRAGEQGGRPGFPCMRCPAGCHTQAPQSAARLLPPGLLSGTLDRKTFPSPGRCRLRGLGWDLAPMARLTGGSKSLSPHHGAVMLLFPLPLRGAGKAASRAERLDASPHPPLDVSLLSSVNPPKRNPTFPLVAGTWHEEG